MRVPMAAVALVLLAVGAASCKPSSLTPFTGTREPDTSTGPNGSWEGVNSTGRALSFNVGNDTVSNLLMLHGSGSCVKRMESGESSADVTDNAFSLEVFFTQGRLVFEGRFTSSTACTGSYFFEGLAETANCPTSGSGTYSAAKTQ